MGIDQLKNVKESGEDHKVISLAPRSVNNGSKLLFIKTQLTGSSIQKKKKIISKFVPLLIVKIHHQSQSNNTTIH